MAFSHESLNVYQRALAPKTFVVSFVVSFVGNRSFAGDRP